jgi:hypothetical protein
MNLLKSAVLLRLCLTLFALVTFCFGLYIEDSLLYTIAQYTDWMGYWSMVAVLPLSLFSLADIAVNDLMPDHCRNAAGLHFRHLVLGSLALMFAIQIYTCARYGFSLASMAYFMLFVVFLPLSAMADLVLRYRRVDHVTRGNL